MESGQNLSSFLVNLSAQMRSDLSSLYLAATHLAPPEMRARETQVDRAAAVFEQSYYRLLRLASSLSSAELLTSSAPPAMENCDLAELLCEQCERAADLVALKGVTLRFVCAMEHHVCAIVPGAIEQAFYHLLSNAVKFTSAGGVVTVELRRDERRLFLSVTDTGCGIPEARLQSLFSRYTDPAAHPEPPPHGFGLGLSICRRVAELHGGTLLAESTEGRGSRFTLSLADQTTDAVVSDVPFLYTGGFSPALLGLADALPIEAFLSQNLD